MNFYDTVLDSHYQYYDILTSYTPNMMDGEESIISELFLTQMHHLSLTMRKHHTDSGGVVFYKITDRYSLKVSRS